jgi:bifunctional DNase/RNase
MVQIEIAAIAFDPRNHQPMLLLKRAGEADPAKRLVPIALGLVEARALVFALQGVELPRPQTHDLMANVLTTLQAQVERVEIHSFDESDGTFYASLTLAQHGVTFIIDARPSDAIALAVRKGAPVFIDDAVYDSTSVETNVVTHAGVPGSESNDRIIAQIRDFAENVQPSDFD